MKFPDNFKKTANNSHTKETAGDAIKEAGMLLDDKQLDKVAGGATRGADEGAGEIYIDDGAIAL